MVQKKLVPPDGGWGWMIMIAYAVFNFIYMPILQNFGLIFKDAFKAMQFTATDASIIINTNAAVSMFMGLVNGPLLKHYGYRKVSLASAMFVGIGLIVTSYSKSFIALIITYGLITSVGVGMGMCSYPLAMNSYFLKKRSKATGFALAITSLGSILMPQIITSLLTLYGVQGTVLLIAGVSLHTFASALLLQPVKWHMIEETTESANTDISENEKGNFEVELPEQSNQSLEAQTVYDFEVNPMVRLASISSLTVDRRTSTTSVCLNNIEMAQLDGNICLYESKENQNSPELMAKPKSVLNKLLANLVNIFELSLMKDPQYVTILIGLAFTLFAESNFSLLTPFILSDIGFDTRQIATFISVMSMTDLILRFLAPFIGDYFKLSARVLFLISLVMLSTTRFCIMSASTFQILIGIGVFHGIAKGIRTVYWSLILPEYVPLDRLGAALSMEMIVNGIVLLCGGPLLGIIRDVTGSYTRSIYVMNALTLTTVFMWTSEIIMRKRREKQGTAVDIN